MKRILIPFLAAFVVSLGVTTGVVMFRASKHAAVATAQKSVKADSTKPATPAAVVSTPVVPDSSTVTADQSEQSATPAAKDAPAQVAAQTQSHATATATATPTAATTQKPATAPPPAPTMSDSMVGRKLGKVFGAMQAKDAARVLEQMDDADVRVILQSLSNRQQAAILGNFPTERAATIMRATLRSVESEQ